MYIKCPECGNKVECIIKEFMGMPFNLYSAYCDKCDYWIGESEIEEFKYEDD